MSENRQTEPGEVLGHKDEPADPAARVVDSNGNVWAGHRGQWGCLTRYALPAPWRFLFDTWGPLRLVESAARPTGAASRLAAVEALASHPAPGGRRYVWHDDLRAALAANTSDAGQSVLDLLVEYSDLEGFYVRSEPDLPSVRCVDVDGLEEFFIQHGAALGVPSEALTQVPAPASTPDVRTATRPSGPPAASGSGGPLKTPRRTPAPDAGR